ncbi:PadR family transcriptional regulator [Methanocella sp. CWC-04]|uniref:PadR family transcriptional regulator n=1 Tax=Methanooceanicella nereidis TaxID=2052831 RepID=A0AAP2RFD8_9EURY|nr:PadR family transcriptional regulator [Methanocella sp. CWC-04]MCD1295105.1 PadR family transcriptional regulator [Methanocella sp. CWC-04]
MEDPCLKEGQKNDLFNNEIRKGFLKLFLLKIIKEKPTHGYDIIQLINQKSEGRWMPSPGSVYPALEFLESKGYISSEEVDRKKVYTITPKGENAVEHISEKRRELINDLLTFLGDD